MKGRVSLLLLSLALAACSVLEPDRDSLRVTNTGSVALVDLTVFSPGSEVNFGTINPGETTEYRVMPGGVYHYAAFEYTDTGERVSQPVIDFVGESPMRGSRFTYSLSLRSAPNRFLSITTVVQDK